MYLPLYFSDIQGIRASLRAPQLILERASTASHRHDPGCKYKSKMSSFASLASIVSASSHISVDGHSICRDSQAGSSGSVQDEYNHRTVDGLTEQSSLDGSKKKINECTHKDAEYIPKSGNSPINNEEENTHSSNSELDLQLWLPPETEDQENDIEWSVANYDDDDEDEGDDGTKWGKPSFLSSFGEGSSRSYRYIEEKQKAMYEVKNYKFKALVSHLLKNAEVASLGEDGDSWVDIVTSLSWEAASFVKPDFSEGKAMDLDGYVKVKCVATGSRSQSRLVKGMIFKKKATHKHMPIYYKKPKLLLIQGALAISSTRLSSFESMEQEKDTLKSIVEGIKMCNPNVILVEKNVARDIQECLPAKKMTLVTNIKFHHLQRVARCTGSSILSSDTLRGKILRYCDSFQFEKFVEEHDGERGKKPSKTLVFLVGCPTRLGCTILLQGANSQELKKIKLVVHYAVPLAYHLILETAFLVDQKAMFSTLPHGLMNLINQPLRSEDSAVDTYIADGLESNSMLPYEPCNPLTNYKFSSLQRHFGISVPHVSPSLQSSSTYMGINEEGCNSQVQSTTELLSNSDGKNHSDIIATGNCGQDKALGSDETSVPRKAQLDAHNSGHDHEDHVELKDDSSSINDSDSILVLNSRRNFITSSICKQRQFSNIKFYQIFDVPLGMFLRDDLLNQKQSCDLCNGLPQAHIHYYAHHNKQLTIKIRRSLLKKHLPGETDEKIWMWSRCGNCKPHNGKIQSTKRVLMSAEACGLSFGKFLQFNLSNHLSSSSFSICGQKLHNNILYFFGLGPMIAMLRYSRLTTYSVPLPPEKLKFCTQISGELLNKDFVSISNLYPTGIKVFLKVESSLKHIGSQYKQSKLNIQGCLKVLSDMEEMLKHERCRFKDDLMDTLNNWDSNYSVYKVFCLNRIRLDILVVSCVWERRLQSLLSSEITPIATASEQLRQEESNKKHDVSAGEEPEDAVEFEKKLETTSVVDVPIEGDFQGSSERYNMSKYDILKRSKGMLNDNASHNQESASPDILTAKGPLRITADPNLSKKKSISKSSAQNSEWIWSQYPDIRDQYMKGLLKFAPIGTYPRQRSTIDDVIYNAGSRLYFPLGDVIISDREDELSSVVACALTLLKDPSVFADPTQKSGEDAKLYERSHFSVYFGGLHPEVSMGLSRLAGKGKYTVVSLYASRFQDLRKQCCPSESDYIVSLSRCRNWDAKGGKSKSFFAKTLDDRFIIKGIQRTEYESFLKFAPDYFNYMNACFKQGNQTCLAKVFGIHQVIIRQKNGKEIKHEVMVMENLTFQRNISRQYDLKGALHARLISAADGAGDVLLDQNFVNDMTNSPFYLSRRAKRLLQRAVWNDTYFLNAINVMDYSLLVGVDSQKGELVCGIIDYLRQYTWDKKLETLVKSSIVPNNSSPTVICPKEYKKRLRKFITTNFVSVPDDWCS